VIRSLFIYSYQNYDNLFWSIKIPNPKNTKDGLRTLTIRKHGKFTDPHRPIKNKL